MNDFTPIANRTRRYQKVDFVIGSEDRGNSGSNGDQELAARTASSNRAPGRWRSDLLPLYPAALDLEFTDPETQRRVRPNTPKKSLIGQLTQGREVGSFQGGVSNPDDFLWLCTLNVGNGKAYSPDALPMSTKFLETALRVAVIANGGALVALAFTIQSVGNSSSAGMAAAFILALGLLFAAISLLAYLNFQLADASGSGLATKRGFGLKGSATAITVSENPAYQAAQTKDVGITSRITTSIWLATISGAGSYAALTLAALWLLPIVIWP